MTLSPSPKERVSELVDSVKDLEAQLSQQEEETKSVIAKWQASCSALEEQNKKLNSQLESSVEKTGKLETSLQEAKSGLEEAKKKSEEDELVLVKWQGESSQNF